MIYTFVKPNKEYMKIFDNKLNIRIGEKVILDWEKFIVEDIMHELGYDKNGESIHKTAYVILKYQ